MKLCFKPWKQLCSQHLIPHTTEGTQQHPQDCAIMQSARQTFQLSYRWSTPWGTPGHLSEGIRQQGVHAISTEGSIYVVQILRATAAKAEQRKWNFWPNAVQIHLQLIASNPEGPATSSACKAEFWMTSAVMLSKRIGWNSPQIISLLKI